MRIEKTDPITGQTLEQLDGRPYVIEGSGEDALKIFFESEESRQRYLAAEVAHPEEGLSVNLDNPAPMAGDEPNGLPQARG